MSGVVKSQSAMEYLMTYGWAILVIAVVLGVLFQLGVFGSANLTPKATPGSCEVQRTTASISLAGMCQGEMPQYVMVFSGATTSNILAPLPTTATYGTTISAWFYQPSSTNYGGIFYLGNGPPYPGSNGYGIVAVAPSDFGGCGGTNPTYVIAVLESSVSWYCFTSVQYKPSAWNNVILVDTQSGAQVTYTAYINGVADTISSVTAPKTPLGMSLIGSTVENDNFAGWISNVQVYNTTLSPTEANALYTEGIGGAPVKPQNIVGWWPLNGNADDYSGGNNNGQASDTGYTSFWTSGYSSP